MTLGRFIVVGFAGLLAWAALAEPTHAIQRPAVSLSGSGLPVIAVIGCRLVNGALVCGRDAPCSPIACAVQRRRPLPRPTSRRRRRRRPPRAAPRRAARRNRRRPTPAAATQTLSLRVRSTPSCRMKRMTRRATMTRRTAPCIPVRPATSFWKSPMLPGPIANPSAPGRALAPRHPPRSRLPKKRHRPRLHRNRTNLTPLQRRRLKSPPAPQKSPTTFGRLLAVPVPPLVRAPAPAGAPTTATLAKLRSRPAAAPRSAPTGSHSRLSAVAARIRVKP